MGYEDDGKEGNFIRNPSGCGNLDRSPRLDNDEKSLEMGKFWLRRA